MKEREALKRLEEPLGILELLTQFREEVVLDSDSQVYKKVSTRYYDIWCQFMKAIKEEPLDPHFLITQQPYICTIPTEASQTIPKLTNKLKKHPNQTIVKNLEVVHFPKIQNPEAGIHIFPALQHISEIPTKEYSSF